MDMEIDMRMGEMLDSEMECNFNAEKKRVEIQKQLYPRSV